MNCLTGRCGRSSVGFFRWNLWGAAAVVLFVLTMGLESSTLKAAPPDPQTVGPIWWSKYTVHDDTLKLQVQLAIDADTDGVTVQFRKDGADWQAPVAGTADALSRTVLFRIDNWDASRRRSYRINHPAAETAWTGVIRRDPVDQAEIKLLAVSCLDSENFPYRETVERIKRQDPDIMFFAGDQIYEGNGGFGIVRARTPKKVPAAMKNYLRKWWYFGMTFRDLMKDRPTIIIPDDHDVYANDLWGDGGKVMTGTRTSGGYPMHPLWVQAVERTQMGHLPDPYDPKPTPSGIRPYYTSLSWGRIGFAILEDRKFKSPPNRVLDEPIGTKSLEIVRDADFDTRKLDKPGLHLLGKTQERFLEKWAKNDKGAAMKVVLSQSPFANVATYHPLDADLDSNGWPQTPRTRALRSIRKARAIMVQGDVHLATLIRHGVDDWNDGPWAMSLPGLHPPTRRAWHRDLGPTEDGFHNRFTLHAFANDQDGYGLIRLRPKKQKVVFECWPTKGDQQPSGWPKTVTIADKTDGE